MEEATKEKKPYDGDASRYIPLLARAKLVREIINSV
jgi:hypothetical protein